MQRAQSALATGGGRLLNSSGEVRRSTNCHRSEVEKRTHAHHACEPSPACSQQARRYLLRRSPRSWVINLWSPGVGPTMVVATAVPSRSSYAMCSKSKLRRKPSLQSCVMDLWSSGRMSTSAATAMRCRISCGVQKIQASDRAFAAILRDGSVVTWSNADGFSSAVYRISCEMCSRSNLPVVHLLHSCVLDL